MIKYNISQDIKHVEFNKINGFNNLRENINVILKMIMRILSVQVRSTALGK